MKRLFTLLFIFMVSTKCFASSYTAPYPNESTGGIIYASHWNSNIQSVQTFLNNNNLDSASNIAVGGISTAALANSSVTDVKIAGITTAGKVNGSAITQVNNIPSGAGLIPTVNLGSGSANSGTVLFGNQTWSSPYAGPVLSAHNTSTQSLGGSAWTQRTFTTVDKDSGGYWTSNTYTPLIAGWYLVTYMDSITVPQAGVDYQAAIYKNGSLYAEQDFYVPSSGNLPPFSVTALIQLNGSTDNLSFYLNNGSASTATAKGTGFSFVSITRVF